VTYPRDVDEAPRVLHSEHPDSLVAPIVRRELDPYLAEERHEVEVLLGALVLIVLDDQLVAEVAPVDVAELSGVQFVEEQLELVLVELAEHGNAAEGLHELVPVQAALLFAYVVEAVQLLQLSADRRLEDPLQHLQVLQRQRLFQLLQGLALVDDALALLEHPRAVLAKDWAQNLRARVLVEGVYDVDAVVQVRELAALCERICQLSLALCCVCHSLKRSDSVEKLTRKLVQTSATLFARFVRTKSK
jgi:hypothetical protein